MEADFFSFNESDYGVEVYQTKENHAFQLKHIGEHFIDKGLPTKMLLGDTGAGTAKANKIMNEVEKDSSLHRFAGAISFHTYHGCTESDLKAWAESAEKTNLPVLVAEGGVNSAAHRFPLVFLEPWFQLKEIDTYIRICNICQPVTIMEWQLTADYTVVSGMGIYGIEGPLRPTQRFFNLKQLGSTPVGSFALPVTCDGKNITCAAFGDLLNGIYSIHLVNNGAARTIHLFGLPSDVKELSLYITDATRGMDKAAETVKVTGGKASFQLEASAYTTLINVSK